ncbi:MAG: CDP-glycerol glycerophosphotransferase family protein [Gemmatimonadetes bacterium]|nr:CDP-glycerol glycerophosphotransferase family protein [Gemmatimonadota bacterium]
MRLLLALQHAYSVPVLAPLVTELLRGGPPADWRVYATGEARAHLPKAWPEVTRVTDLAAAQRFAPDAVLTAENHVDFRLPGLKVQLFHGVGVEKASHYVIRHWFDLYCTSGPMVTARYEALARQHGYFRVAETGWPKFDHILATQPAIGAADPYRHGGVRRVVLYAPTFSRRLQSADDLSALFPQVIRDDEYWLLKFHELMPPALIERFRRLQGPQLQLLGPGDITPALHAADVMISDTSSVVYEFLCLGKPVITYRARANVDKALNIEQPEALRPALDLLLADPDHGRAAREAMLQQVNPYLDGRVAARVLDAVAQALAAGPPRGARKPLNLFRKARYLWQSQRRALAGAR